MIAMQGESGSRGGPTRMLTTLDVPALPVAHTRALAVLSDQNAAVALLAQVIESDPSLTAAVLRAANAASSAPISRIDSAHVAVVRIGLGPTRQLVVSAIATRSFEHLDRAGLDVEELWRHQLATALVGHALSAATTQLADAGGDAFTAGVLHDVGRLSMAAQEPDRYREVARLVHEGVEAMEAERRVFDLDHAEWGGHISRAWQIPEPVSEAIESHHDAPTAGSLAAQIADARRIVLSVGIGDGLLPGVEPAFPEREHDVFALARLGGVDGLFAQLEWYRGALDSAA